MKKFFSLVLALVMALSLTTVAWGATNYASSGVNCETDTEVSATHTGNVTFVGTDDAREDVAIRVTGNAVIEDAVLNAADRGIDGDGAFTSITIDNVTVVNSTRAIHIQSSTAATLNVSNSTFAGKISYLLAGGTATFTNCTFKANSALTVKGNMVEPWSETVFVNCVFEDGFEVSFDDWNNVNADSSKAMTLTNCTYDGEPLTADNMDELFTNTTGVDVDDAAYVYNAADGANNSTSGVYAKGTYEGAAAVDVTVYYFKALDNEVDEETGAYVADGNVEYYTLSTDTLKYAKVATVAAADMVIYTDAACKNVYMYLDVIDPVYYGDGAVVTNFGKACGQYTDAKTAGYNAKATYYTAFDELYVGAEAGAAYTKQLLVNGVLVQVNDAPNTLIKNAHKAIITTDKTGKVESIKCAVCGVAAIKAGNYASVPTNAVIEMQEGNAYWYWPVVGGIVVGGTTSSTVQSAQTFDAGIAMYVGMSVMAAAGSAVVIGKKKD